MTDELCEVCITAPDPDWLARLVTRLVDERLCACGHVIGPVRAIYRWRGEVRDHTEARAALHTRRSSVAAIVRVVEELHPYELPGVFVLPLVDGSTAYLDWVRAETSSGADREPPTATGP